jgi:hypothetical protein
MVHIFKNTEPAANNNIINRAQVLGIFWQADATAVRYNRDVELLGHQKNS